MTAVADAFADHLFDYSLRERLGHHISHLASERWLAMELAYSFNRNVNLSGLSGWSAALEQQAVDVTILPPTGPATPDNEESPIYMECKMVGPPYWSVWNEIALDLDGKRSSKPKATFAVCFLYEILPQSIPNQRPDAKARDQRFLASIPESPGLFKPDLHELEFELLHSSKNYLIEWPEPIPGRWPHGFAAAMRVLWVAKPKSGCADMSEIS